MSQSGSGLYTPEYLSWRKLQLSRAKLKASSKTSALLSGFAMVAMVELQLNGPPNDPCTANCTSASSTKNSTADNPEEGLVIAFAICTTLLVAVHMLALMISTCILPNIEAVCNLDSVNLVRESPHERLHWYIEVAWAFSTLLGLVLFLVEIALLCWLKFVAFSISAAWSACVVLIPVMIIFLVFAVHFYKNLVAHKCDVVAFGLQELEVLQENIESSNVKEKNSAHLNQGNIQIV